VQCARFHRFGRTRGSRHIRGLHGVHRRCRGAGACSRGGEHGCLRGAPDSGSQRRGNESVGRRGLLADLSGTGRINFRGPTETADLDHRLSLVGNARIGDAGNLESIASRAARARTALHAGTTPAISQRAGPLLEKPAEEILSDE